MFGQALLLPERLVAEVAAVIGIVRLLLLLFVAVVIVVVVVAVAAAVIKLWFVPPPM